MGKVTVTRQAAPPVSFDLIGTGSTSSGRKQPANSKCLYSPPPLVDGRSAGRCAGSRAGTKGGKAGRACPACRRCKQLQCLPLSTERGRTADIWQQSSQQRTRGLLAQGGDQCEGTFSLETKVSSASAVTICLNYLVPPLPHAMRQLFSSQHPTLLSTFIGYRHRIRMTTSFRLFFLGEFHPFTPNFGHRMDSSSAASLSNATTVSKNLKKNLKKYVKQTQIRMINNEVIAIKLS